MATTVFEFLYYLHKEDEKHLRVKSIRAQNIKWACIKFMKRAPESLVKVDYEVRINGDDFIDISDIEGVKDHI